MEIPQIVRTYIDTFCRQDPGSLPSLLMERSVIRQRLNNPSQGKPSKMSLADCLRASQMRPPRQWRCMRSPKTWWSGAGLSVAPTPALIEVSPRPVAV